MFYFSKLLLLTALSAPICWGASALSAPSQTKSKAASGTPTHRTVIHSEAYKKRAHLGEHINFKITPPEKRGKKNHVLVEVYNYSKKYVNVCSFWLILSNNWGDRIEVELTVDDLKPSWSALRWVKVPGDKPLPTIEKVEIKNFQLFDDQARKLNLKYYTDLIKI
jgi:hypothetical protein